MAVSDPRSAAGDLWINNAGLDGHSTYGHLHLFSQYLTSLRPKVLLYLIGINDVGADRALTYDENLRRIAGKGEGIIKRAYLFLVENTATCALFDNFRRQRQAIAAGVTHGNMDHQELKVAGRTTVIVTEDDRIAILEEHRLQFLPAYESRLRTLIQATRAKKMLG